MSPSMVSFTSSLLLHLTLTLLFPLSHGFTARFEINEGVPLESHVGSLASHGHTASGSLMYNKVSNPKDASKYFNVDKFSGRISVAADLDREAICTPSTHKPDDECTLKFSVTCLRVVGGSVDALADVAVILRDVNDNGCEFIPSSEQVIKIREDADVDKTRVRLYTPHDPDSARLGHSIQWNQVRLEDPSATFQLHVIHSSSGNNLRNSYRQQDAQLYLGLLRPLDYESTKHYRLSVVAGDGLHECKLAVRVEIEDADDNLPIFEKAIYNVTIPENLSLNEKIVAVKAHDADAGEFGRVLYSIDPFLTDPSTLEVFHIDQDTGEIFRRSKLNYQDLSQYQLTIKASNGDHASVTPSTAYSSGGQPTFLTKVIITLEDVNDHEPVITIFSPTGSKKLTLTENLPGGQDVAILSVEDKDTGMNAIVECQLKSQSIRGALSLRPMASDLESFEDPLKVATNRKYKLLATRSFDREQHPAIHFTIECWDGGKPVMRSIQKEMIHILDVNDCAPVFENETHHFRVFEDPSPGNAGTIRSTIQTEHIGQIKARDEDLGQNAKLQFKFSPECPETFLELVQLDKDTGVLQSTGGLDREKFASLSCKVIVSDMGTPPLSSQTEVEIEILDLNDNPPQFELSEYNFQVEENSHPGTLIGIVRVFDADLGSNSKLEFSLEGVQPALWSKETDMESLFSSVRPNREKPSSQHLNLLRFEALAVRKHLPTGGPYSRNFSFHGNEGGSPYEVRIYTAAPIDREALASSPSTGGSSYLLNNSSEAVVLRLILRAQDSGSPRLVGRVPINLRVSDVNDNSPVFIFPPMDSVNATEVRLSIREPVGFQFSKPSSLRFFSKSGTDVYLVYLRLEDQVKVDVIFASDPDAGENASLIYRIRAGDPFDLFQLDSRTGDLSVAKEYSSTGQYMGQYLLFLEASDRGSPRRFSEAQLLVHIDDSEPLGRLERDIFGFPIRSSGRGIGGVSSRSMNLYIIAAIIIASFVISTVLLVAICLVVRRARTSENGRSGRYPGERGGGGLQNGSIFHDGGLGNGYLKSVPLSLAQTKYATCDPLEEEGFIRLACLPAKQAHTLGRCSFIGQKKLAEDRLTGKRNSLTDRDSGNGDSLDVGSCLLAYPPSMEAPRSATPCFQHFQHLHQQHGFQTPSVAFPIVSETQLQQHSPFLATTSSPTNLQEVMEAAADSVSPLTSTFV
ncbi:hypothetical protein Aperf_G00000038949 [Anoplocephala perfoliata]